MKKLLTFLTTSILLLLLIVPAVAQDDEEKVERPLTEELLPETAVLFVQIENIKEFFEKASETGIGQMFQEDSIQGLTDELYSQVEDAYDEFAKDEVGLEIDDFRSLPQGEIAFAVIAPKRDDLQFALFMEIDEESEEFQSVIDRGREIAEEEGEPAIIEETADVTFETFTIDGQPITTFTKDGLYVAASNRELAEQFIDRWMEIEVDKIRPLTENRKFATVMNRCRGTKDTPPDMRFFIDPIGLARGATRGNAGAQFVINLLPTLGLDGLSAIGASAIFDEMGFESVGHAHVLLNNPRAGVIEMLALKPGEYEPEDWVPVDVGTYVSTSWDFDRFYAELTKIVDTFMGEGEFEKQVEENINQQFAIDMKEDVLGMLDGRFTYTTWFDIPATLTSQVQVFSLHIKDEDKLMFVRDQLFAVAEANEELDTVEEVDYKGVSYWKENTEMREERIERRRLRRMERALERGREVRIEAQEGTPCVALIGDCLVIATSTKFMERAIDTQRGEYPSLAENEEFVETTDKIIALLRKDMPGAIFYNQPAKGMEMMMDLANDDEIRGMMGNFDQIEEDEEPSGFGRFLGGVNRALEENPLPEFEDIQHYFAPSGGFITNDETGYHIMTFQLKYDR